MQDKDGNGSISIEELREGLTIVMGAEADPDAADGIMAALDVSGDGEINYTEFIAAVCDHQRMLADHTLAGIFGELAAKQPSPWACEPAVFAQQLCCCLHAAFGYPCQLCRLPVPLCHVSSTI